MDKNSYKKNNKKEEILYGRGLMFPKMKYKKRKKHKKSILQNETDRHCFLCMMAGNYQLYDVLHEHHIFFGTANRKKSEEYGMKVNLCLTHHETGEHAVHKDRDTDMKLKRIAQEKFEETHSREEFRKIFGKSYL